MTQPEQLALIRRAFEQGHTTQAAELLLDYIRRFRPGLEDRALLLLKDLRQFDNDAHLGLAPDPAARRRSERGLLDLMKTAALEAESLPADDRLRDVVLPRLMGGAAWLLGLLIRPAVFLPLLLFGGCYALGTAHAGRVNARVSPEQFYESYVLSHLNVEPDAGGEGFSLSYACGGSRLYRFRPDSGLQEIPMLISNAGAWLPAAARETPVESYVVMGGLTWVIASPGSFRQFLRLAFDSQGGQPQRLVLLAAVVCGYAYGYYRTIRPEPSCPSAELQAYLGREAFWQRLHTLKQNQMTASREALRRLQRGR